MLRHEPSNTRIRADQIYECLLAAARKGECAPSYPALAAAIEYPCDDRQAKAAMEDLQKRRMIERRGRHSAITFPAHPGISTSVDFIGERVRKFRSQVSAALLAGAPLDDVSKHVKCGRRVVAAIYQEMLAAGEIAPRPKPMSRIREWRKKLAPPKRALTDAELYGDLAGPITTLRRARFGVYKAETVGKPRGMWCVGQKLVTADQLRQMAERFASAG